MAIEGSLDVFHLPEILQVVSAQRKTGILTVQGENDIVAVSFKGGEVVAADALNQTVEEGLGQVLASQGLVSPKDFSGVAAEHEAGGRRLLDLLLERGLVTRPQLLEALRVQTYQLLLQLLRWDQGEFKFYSGDEVAYEPGFAPISVEELLIRSVSDLGVERGVETPELDEVYERVAGGPPIKYIGHDGNGTADDPRAVWLAPEDRQLVEGLDGRRSAEELASQTGLGTYKVLFDLYLLMRGGAVRKLTREAPVAAAPARSSGAVVAPPPEPLLEGAGEGAAEAAPAAAPVVAPARRAPPREEVAIRKERERVVPRRAAAETPVLSLAGRLALTVMAVLAVVALASRPASLVLPLPWQESERELFERNQRTALYLHVDRAARTFFLLEGRYPDELRELPDLGLLPGRAATDSAGRQLAYSAGDVSYEILPVERGEPVEELTVREAITGDFLLDPEFLDIPEPAEAQPLVLLD